MIPSALTTGNSFTIKKKKQKTKTQLHKITHKSVTSELKQWSYYWSSDWSLAAVQCMSVSQQLSCSELTSFSWDLLSIPLVKEKQIGDNKIPASCC